MPKRLSVVLPMLLAVVILSCGSLEPKRSDPPLEKTQFGEIHKYAEFAHAVYQDTPKVQATLAAHGYTLVKLDIIEGVHVQYFVATNPATKTQVVSIRGTANLENALVDMKIKMERDNHAEINLHRGFANAAEGVYQQIRPLLNKDYTLHTVGHSLGGAVALILAIYLDIDKFKVGGVTTFGQPKVTDRAGANKFSALPITRVVTEKDVVPLVPPIDLSVFNQPNIYWHLGEEIVIFPDTYYSALKGQEAMLRSVSVLQANITANELDAHRMANYLTLLLGKRTYSQNIPYRDRAQYLESYRSP